MKPAGSPPRVRVYIEEKNLDALSKSELDALIDEALDYDEVRNGKLSTTDGPFAETKEQLGGFILMRRGT